MIFSASFFQPKEFYTQSFGIVSQIYDNQYHIYMRNFMEDFAKHSPQDAKHFHNQLCSYFGSTNVGYTALNDRERFWIMRALARFSSRERTEILLQGLELSPDRPSYEIIDALCLMTCDRRRQFFDKKPNLIADEEQSLQNAVVRNLIYQALLLVQGGAQERLSDNRNTLARYFLVVGDVEAKRELAYKVINSLTNTGQFTLETCNLAGFELKVNPPGIKFSAIQHQLSTELSSPRP